MHDDDGEASARALRSERQRRWKGAAALGAIAGASVLTVATLLMSPLDGSGDTVAFPWRAGFSVGLAVCVCTGLIGQRWLVTGLVLGPLAGFMVGSLLSAVCFVEDLHSVPRFLTLMLLFSTVMGPLLVTCVAAPVVWRVLEKHPRRRRGQGPAMIALAAAPLREP